MSHRRTIKEKARAPASLDRFVGQSDFGGMPASMVHRSVEPLATEVAPVALDPHAARLVAAFRDAPVRMRDGEELTVEDLNVAKELPQLVQATNDASLAATVMPWFSEVFQGRRAPSIPAPSRHVPKSPEPRWW
jgi:hypothetical protein